ncbi:hypothetical protein Acr_23g0008890 [Actinidia rufa]|uniref:BED-type domain-containing protein n=1 Tax=Actinidia rufa TaxID=165716 RepID=A0A7J0GPG2_9ERIC|nr:hypothetical protein Acr_23g0008890 [Actinidia rufa]
MYSRVSLWFAAANLDKDFAPMSVVKNECAMVASPSETSTGGKRKREGKLRSKVWEHFTKHENKPECVCNHCERVFSCKTNAGTTPLQRHIFWGRCAVYKKENEGKVETLPKNTKRSLGQDRNFVPRNFDEECSLRDLTELIINWELPFNFVEDPSFQKYIRGIYPTYKFPSWITMRSDCMKRYEVEKNILKDILEHSKPRVCLTFDTWTSSKDLPYMAIRVHFIDKGWKLHKRIINFVLVPVKESGENLADVIIRCLLEWNIKKICTITLDNCTTNDVLARTLSEHYSSRSSLLLQGCAVQVRCWGRILNLIVQEGLDEIKDSIRRIRNAVKYVKMTPGKEFEFLQFADQEGIPRGKMLALDNYTQWNSTYKMLGSVLPYRWAYDRMRSCDRHFKDPPTPEDWEKAKIVPTDLGSLRGRMALNMLEKFEKYWMEKEPNILLSVAVVLDPRCKLKYLRFCYNKIYDSSLVGDLMDRVEGELRKLFDEYMAEYEASCCVEATSNKSSDEGTPSVISTSAFQLKMNSIEDFFKFSEEEDVFQSKTELDDWIRGEPVQTDFEEEMDKAFSGPD